MNEIGAFTGGTAFRLTPLSCLKKPDDVESGAEFCDDLAVDHSSENEFFLIVSCDYLRGPFSKFTKCIRSKSGLLIDPQFSNRLLEKKNALSKIEELENGLKAGIHQESVEVEQQLQADALQEARVLLEKDLATLTADEKNRLAHQQLPLRKALLKRTEKLNNSYSKLCDEAKRIWDAVTQPIVDSFRVLHVPPEQLEYVKSHLQPDERLILDRLLEAHAPGGVLQETEFGLDGRYGWHDTEPPPKSEQLAKLQALDVTQLEMLQRWPKNRIRRGELQSDLSKINAKLRELNRIFEKLAVSSPHQ
ncbi:hypothetical protein [Variovorax saccharolyticus]|uniref:hypothetical protein n=1 Tax=Variovorax saccharolyticus TaxID=3053516 RepID=UPI0025767909|nr:hypothetical protein [Variovorax sp. J31P216]MDM0029893.1 hypothetical protein [Variovorax sp. J31P216]